MIRDTISEMESFDQDDTPTEGQPPLSPAGGAESLFLAGLATSKISADALSTKLRHALKYPSSIDKRSTSAASVRSVLTDDFQSCAEFSDDLDNFTDDEQDDDETHFFSIFRKSTSSMPSSAKSSKKTHKPVETVPPLAPTPAPAPAPKDGLDVAEQVYEKAKGVWAWGKGTPIISIGFGITEAVVGKAVSLVGTDFEKIDKEIKPHLATLDHDIINPTIEKVVGVVLGAAGKTENVLKPIVIKILSPFGLIKNEAENPELTK